MDQNAHQSFAGASHPAEPVGSIPQASEGFRNVPHSSEAFGTVPNHAEEFRTIPHRSERKDSHTLTVREVARLFETAGVARTERSITNWCQPNRDGIARLDSYFDPNERKYFISRQSVDLAIEEEKAKASKESREASSDAFRSVPNPPEPKIPEPVSESFRTIPKPEPEFQSKQRDAFTGVDPAEVKALEQELLDSRITNKGKDYFIDQLKEERKAFALEREGYVQQLMSFNRKVGELETKLLQLEAGERDDDRVTDSATRPAIENINPEPTLSEDANYG